MFMQLINMYLCLLTPAEDVVAPLRATFMVLAVRMRGVGDDDVEVEGLVHEPGEGGQEEVVKHDGERMTQDLVGKGERGQ